MTNYPELHREIGRGTGSGLVYAWVVDVLTEIADGRRQLRAVRHPLGFICLPVDRSGDDGICVHLWPAERPAVAPLTSAMHSHSWDLLSQVLYGEVRNEIVQVTDVAAEPTHRIYEVHSRGDLDEVLATPRLVRARTGTVETHGAGASYALPAGSFHTSEVPDGVEAATVALGRTAPGAWDLSLGPLRGQTHRTRRERCDAAETAR
ncbi:hypothetical protein, partial [Plantactinospora sp. CA-290183]|uniref:hypothetical protein n=1 Tax=Plantactinospora sp. CA-290183 TaxID=3240006 RepID=UPI003D8A846F